MLYGCCYDDNYLERVWDCLQKFNFASGQHINLPTQNLCRAATRSQDTQFLTLSALSLLQTKQITQQTHVQYHSISKEGSRVCWSVPLQQTGFQQSSTTQLTVYTHASLQQ